MIRAALVAVVILLFAACASIAPSSKSKSIPSLTHTTFAMLTGWLNDNHSAALLALIRSCKRMAKTPVRRSLGAGGLAGNVADWQALCAAAVQLSEGNDYRARLFFEIWFTPYLAAVDGNAQGLFTGYYEAQLHGSWQRHGRYQTPIYSLPVGDDMARTKSRGEIIAGALNGRGLELLWVDDAVDAFFLHVQGSGRVLMEDGRVVRLGFAGRNGHKYASIGRELINSGAIAKQQISMQSIRTWIYAHPRQGAELMAQNPSYIYFKIVKKEGPIGAQGVALSPGRSLAIDKRFVPFGLPIWLNTTYPLEAKRPLRRLVIAQDTGGAIKGAVRGDLFFGFGDVAAKQAGAMNQTGRYYLLIPKNVAP